jgi:hypothetical protein
LPQQAWVFRASLLAHAILFVGLPQRIPRATFSTNQTKDNPAERASMREMPVTTAVVLTLTKKA